MSDPTENTPLTVEVAAPQSVTSVDLNRDGDFNAKDIAQESVSVDPTAQEVEDGLEPQELEDGDELPSDAKADEAEPEEQTSEGDPEELPDFDISNEEVVSKYDAKYLKADEAGNQVLNLDAFNAELEANLKAGKLDINPGSREFVKATLGVDDKGIDIYLQGLKAQADAVDNAIYSKVGGAEAWDGLIAWGKANYTPEQQKRFNEALQKGGSERDEQIELLVSRAGGKAGNAQGKAPGLRGRRSSSPAKQAGGSSASASKVEPYANSEEHRIALVEAGEDPKKVAETRKRLMASPWFTGK